MTNTKTKLATTSTAATVPLSVGWQQVEASGAGELPQVTSHYMGKNFLLVQGSFVQHDKSGRIMLSMEPFAIDRKLAIRDLNDRLEGKERSVDTGSSIKRKD